MHSTCPSNAAYLPLAHATQSFAVVLPATVPYVPLAHPVQLLDPSVEAYVPTPHAGHPCLGPVIAGLEKLPGAHGRQSWAPIGTAVALPTGQVPHAELFPR